MLFGFLLILACGSTQLVQTSPEAIAIQEPTAESEVSVAEASTVGVLEETITKPQFTTADKIEVLIGYLASDDLQGRDSGSEGIEKAAEFIEDYLKAAGIKPYYKSYRDTLSNYKPTSFNVVGVLEGNDPVLKEEYILIGAHYDHIGFISPVQGDTIANGANDNASGSTVVMEIARYFARHKNNKRSLIFAWFSAEERGLLGSKHLAKRMKEEELNLYAMLNYEMVGVPMESKGYVMYVTGYGLSNVAEVANAYAGDNLLGFLPTAKTYGLFSRSDNYPFAKEFGVPSHTFCTFDFTNFEYYHQPGDEVKVLDLEHMAKVVNKSIPMLKGIANGPVQELKMNK